MSTPPRLDDNYKAFSIPEPSPLDTEAMRRQLQRWQEQDEADRVQGRRDAIICAALAVALLVACYAFGVSITDPLWLHVP